MRDAYLNTRMKYDMCWTAVIIAIASVQNARINVTWPTLDHAEHNGQWFAKQTSLSDPIVMDVCTLQV